MKNNTISIIGICLSLILSCGDKQEKPNLDLVPLAVGNTWNYARFAISVNYRDTMSVVIVDEDQLEYDGRPYTAYTQFNYFNFNDNPYPWRWMVRTDKDGHYQFASIIVSSQSGIDTLVINDLVYKYPAEIGDSTFVKRFKFAGGVKNEIVVFDTVIYTLISKDEEIETPAGTFSCYVYKHYRPPFALDVLYGDYVYEYFVPGIGKVAKIIEAYSVPGYIKHKTLLYDYHLSQ